MADHVELTPTHLIIGLQIEWYNQTDQPIPVKELQAWLYLHGRNKDPLRIYPLERFARVPNQRALQKTPLRPFSLPAKETYADQIRFISQEILDIPAGSYSAVIQIIDTSDVIYKNQITLQLVTKIKYRKDEDWQLDEQ